jgi:hypothetical protein
MIAICRSALSLSFIAVLTVATASCASEGGGDGPECDGDKCDDPGSSAQRQCELACEDSSESDCVSKCREGKAMEHCEARRSDAVDSSQKAFVGDAIRWACSDVEGVNTDGQDDRGQEYCEYYAVVQPPPAEEGGATPPAVDLGRNGSGKPLALELTEDQLFALEDNSSAIVGQCLFTSWHSDVEGELPACDAGAVPGACPALSVPDDAALPPWMTSTSLGLELTAEMAQMKVSINSNGAAVDLLEKCMVDPPAGDPENDDDPLNDDYIRGCWKSFQLFGTEWRRSDPTICVAAMRAAECGCGVDSNGDGTPDVTAVADIARALVPRQPSSGGAVTLRGFRLGTWSGASALPAGCRYLDTGDQSQTLVGCNLTAGDVLSAQTDVKGKCREKYGDNVVVHIPVPGDALVCAPPADGQYSASCGDMVPWTEADSTSAECCRTCSSASKPCGDSCISKDSTCNQEPGCACAGS